MTDQNQKERYRLALRVLTAALVIGFMAALWLIIRPFWMPLLWAMVLTSTTWPIFSKIRSAVPSPPYLAPLLSSLLLGMVLIVILVPLPVQLALELKEFAAHLTTFDPAALREKTQSVPLIGEALADLVNSALSDPTVLATMIDEHRAAIVSFATSVARGVLTTMALTLATLIGCFSLYLHGETLSHELRGILGRLGGENSARLLDTVHITVRGAAYSVLATSVAQGVLAGIGYRITGAPTPLLLGFLTMIVSIIPFGPPFMYVPVSAYLLFFSGLPWYHGAGLALWGILVVSTIDNVLRPLFISQTTKLSAILVFVGVLGGVASMGLLGVFVGPAIMAVAHWLWLELAQTTKPAGASTT